MCYYPKLMKNKRYVKNKKNGGNVPEPKDKRLLYVPIGCGNCMACRKRKANEWKIRLYEEIRHRKGQFVTFTFSDKYLVKIEEKLRKRGCTLEHEDMENAIAKYAVDRFAIRFKNKYKRRPRRWFVTELGGTRTQRIHLHGIYFEDTEKEELEKLWKYGNIWVGDYCTRSSITYIVKYMTKVDKKHPYYKGIVLTSNGMGRKYREKGNFERSKYRKDRKTRDYYVSENGFKMSNPIYYRNMLYSEEERENLWLEKLDEQIRYIGGVKIDLKHKRADEWIERVLKDKRELNKLCGFGSDEINYDVRRYNRRQRYMQKLTRIAKVKKTLDGASY